MATTLDLTLGALEIGTMLSIFLYGIISVQFYMYTQADFKDHLVTRLLVCHSITVQLPYTLTQCSQVATMWYGQASTGASERSLSTPGS